MFVHYLQVAVRHLLKHPLNSVIKILGLALGLAGALLVMIVNYSELTWDSFWPEAEQIYLVRGKTEASNLKGFQDSVSEVDYYNFRAALAGKLWFSEIRPYSVAVSWTDEAVEQTQSQQLLTLQVAADFLEIFQPKIIAGDLGAFVSDPNTAFITKKAAEKLFGKTNPIGMLVTIPQRPTFSPQHDNVPTSPVQARIIAVVDMDNPRSQIPGGIYYPKLEYPLRSQNEYFESWEVYAKPKEELDRESIAALLNQVVASNLPEVPEARRLRETVYQLMPITERHLHDGGSAGNQQRILILGVLGLLILVVALSNFINLGLAGHVARQKEVALRRVHGAAKTQLLWQYWVDSLIYVSIACLLALMMCESLLPKLSADLQLPLVDGVLVDPQLAGAVVILMLLASCVVALYPAIYFSKQNAATILRANRSTENHISIFVRKTLLNIQFVAASGLIIGLASIYLQLKFIDNYKPGYKTKDIVMLVDQSGSQITPGQLDVLGDRLKQLPGYIAASSSVTPLPGQNERPEEVTSQIDDQQITVNTNAEWFASPDYFAAMGIPILAGNRETLAAGFELTAEGARPATQVVLCRTTAQQLGFKSPEDALGQRVQIFKWIGANDMDSRVRAVVDDVHLGSHKLAPKPCMFLSLSGVGGNLIHAVNLDHPATEAEIAHIKAIWQEITGAKPHHWLLAGSLADQYRHERNIEWFLMLFALVALVIGILGVYGMTALSTQKRAREIALRKLHGASAWQILGHINRDMTRIVLVANLIAWPVAGYLVNRWLENFYQHFSLAIWLPQFCALALALGLFSVWFTASLHSVAQGRIRPADVLRDAN